MGFITKLTATVACTTLLLGGLNLLGALGTVVLVLFAAMRERIAIADVPAPFRGAAIGLISAGLMSLAFMGFTGLIKL